MSGPPSVTHRTSSTLRARICNTKTVVAQNTPLQITSYDNNKQGVIIHNQSATIDVWVSFDQGTQNTSRLKIVPGGFITFDFAISEPLFAFTTTAGATANCVVLEVSGFDTYQLLTAQLLEMITDNTGKMVSLLAKLIGGRK